MKNAMIPHLPQPMRHIDERNNKKNIHGIVMGCIRELQSTARKNNAENALDMSGDVLTRRIDAICGIIEKVMARNAKKIDKKYDLTSAFVQMNFLPMPTYNEIDEKMYVVYAASLWILDRISESCEDWEREIKSFLPDQKTVERAHLRIPNVWHSQYSTSLIKSVMFAIYTRNATDKTDIWGDGGRLINSCVVHSKTTGDWDLGKPYEKLVNMIPVWDVEKAVHDYVDCTIKWIDTCYDAVAPIYNKAYQMEGDINKTVDSYNALRERLVRITNDVQSGKPPAKKPGRSPLLASPVQNDVLKDIKNMQPMPVNSIAYVAMHDPRVNFGSVSDSRCLEMIKIIDEMKVEYETCQKRTGEWLQLQESVIDTLYTIINDGSLPDEDGKKNADLVFGCNPYAYSFALIDLLQTGSDYPWLYGPGTCVLKSVTTALPWAYLGANEAEDDLHDHSGNGRNPDKESIGMDWERCEYMPDETGELKSVSQLLCKYTGCVVSKRKNADPGMYKMFLDGGVPERESSVLSEIIGIYGNLGRRVDSGTWGYYDEDDEEDEESLPNELSAGNENTEELKLAFQKVKEENKQLRRSLHDADRAMKEETDKRESVLKTNEMDRKELANLRELVFRLTQKEYEDESVDTEKAECFPYDVKQSILIFGGHATWLKAIKPMLNGNVRFIDKDLVFDANIIRYADVVWIQTNALSHKQYDRITDNARIFRTPVRYFLYASAGKCAEQVMVYDASAGKDKK